MKTALPFIMMLIASVVGFTGIQLAKSGYEFDFTTRSPAQVLKRLGEAESALNRIYENLASTSPEEAVSRGMAQLKQLESNYELLGKYELDSDVERAAQMCVMRSYYLVQSMMPQWKDSFQSQASRVISLRPDSDDAAIARVLLFCSKHDLESDAEVSLLTAIGNEATSYGANRHGVGLYSVVAHEFWKNGKAESAEKVLATGIAHYKGCDEKITLVHQMIDQGHREPPEQKITQAQFMRMQRALANTSTGTGVKFRS